MKKMWKRVMAAALAAVMTIGMSAAAFGDSLTADANTEIVTSSTTVTIDNVEAPDNDSITFTTYQVIYATYDATSNSLEYHLTSWAHNALKDQIVAGSQGLTEEEVVAAMIAQTPTGTGTTEQRQFVNQLAEYSGTDKTAYTVTWTVNAKQATASLPVGAYLVTAAHAHMSFLNMMVTVDTSGTTGASSSDWVLTPHGAVLKGEPITIDKAIVEDDAGSSSTAAGSSSTTAGVGDTVSYKITVAVPKFPSNWNNPVFTVTDTPKNLQIKEESVGVYKGKSKDDSNKLTKDKDYVLSINSNGVMTINLAKNYETLFYANGTYPVSEVTVWYDAEVLASAETTMKNGVKLDYGPDSDHKTNVEGPEPKVYTYGLELTKYGDSQSKLSNAVFEILATNSNAEPASYEKLNFVANSDGTYSLADSTKTNNDYAELITGTAGTLKIVGLAADKNYIIKEAKAPSGYSLNTNTLLFNIKAAVDETSGEPTAQIASVTKMEKDANGDPILSGKETWTCTTDSAGTAILNLSLTDTKLQTLPATGGIGTTIFTIGGVLLMGIAVLLLFISKRSNKADN